MQCSSHILPTVVFMSLLRAPRHARACRVCGAALNTSGLARWRSAFQSLKEACPLSSFGKPKEAALTPARGDNVKSGWRCTAESRSLFGNGMLQQCDVAMLAEMAGLTWRFSQARPLAWFSGSCIRHLRSVPPKLWPMICAAS